LFSLGIVLCEAVTGSNPFARPSLIETTTAIGQTPASAAPVTVRLPDAIKAVVVKALQKAPASRYESVAELATDLQRILATLDAPAAPRARTRHAVVGVVALAAVCTAGGIGYQRLQRRQWVREQATAEIVRLASAERTVAAFSLIHTAERYLPGDAALQAAAAAATRVASIHSSPSGARVDVKDYFAPR